MNRRRDDTLGRSAKLRSLALPFAFALGLALQPAIAVAGDPSISAITGRAATSLDDPQESLAAATAQTGGLGVYYDSGANEYVAVYPRAVAASAATTALASIPLRVRVEYRDITVDAVKEIENALLARDFAPQAEDVTFGTFFDPKSGKVVIDSTAGPSVFDSLVRKYPGSIDVRASLDGGREARNNDGVPHWGGAYINSPVGGCTSGYSVKKPDGSTFMVTAAHCANLGDQITGGTGIVWGNVTDRGPFPAWDVELISGNHAGSIYSGNAVGTQQHVKGAADPAVGSTSYCISGRTSTETCGHHAVSLNGSLCDPSGCTNGLAVYNDGVLTAAGDSGAPWYNYPAGGGVTIRGSHVGRIGGSMYAERWLATKAHWTLTIIVS